MKKLYTIQAANSYQSLLIDKADEWTPFSSTIHKSKHKNTIPTCFHFEIVDRRNKNMPDICTTYLPGVVAFSEEVKNIVLPIVQKDIELIPILVDQKPWFILSCMQTVSDVDFDNSNVMRGLNNEIFMIFNIRVVDVKANNWEMFTIDGSNRGQLFVTESFRSRIEKHKLKGIVFKEIGEMI